MQTSQRTPGGAGAPRLRVAPRTIIVALLAFTGLTTGCGTGTTEQTADVELRSTSEEGLASSAISSDETIADAETGDDTESAPDGPTGPGGDPMVTVSLPVVPPVVLPDLSVLSATGELVKSQLGDLPGAGVGLEVVGASCADAGGELIYQGSEDTSFFDLAVDGSGTYQELNGDRNLDITINPDGSGRYDDLSGDNNLTIEVNADGSGRYDDLSGERNITIEVNADGTGVYDDLTGENNLTVEINADGTGHYDDLSGDNNLTIDVYGDGYGRYDELSGDFNIDLERKLDGSLHYSNLTGDRNVKLDVNPDGSGIYDDLSGNNNLTIEVDSEGNGVYDDIANGVEFTFTTDIGILDPAVVMASPMPVFAIADRFPPLASLGRITPPCVSVIRLDADALFDFDSDQLRPEAQKVVEQVATALNSTAEGIEVHGHTDSIGDEAYNQDLAARRAENFAAALTAAGVTNAIETVSFGESRPVAPNERADGSDNPAGRQQNRRIEVVIPE